MLGRSERELNRLRGRALAFIFQNPTTYLNPLLTVGAQIVEVFEVAPELLATEGGGRLSARGGGNGPGGWSSSICGWSTYPIRSGSRGNIRSS